MSKCPICDQRDLEKYGFILVDGASYYTMVKEVKACCPIKVTLVSHNGGIIKFTHNNVEYSKSYIDFMTSSWRDFDSF